MLRQTGTSGVISPENHFVLSTFNYLIQPSFYDFEITVSSIFENSFVCTPGAESEITACHGYRRYWPGSGTCSDAAC
jgi:hypothetical protein